MGKVVFNALLFAILTILALLALYVVVMVISGLFVDMSKDYMFESKYYRALLDIGMKIAIIGAGIHLKIEGLDQVPTDGRFLIVSNHRSKFDPIVTWYVLRDKHLAFISKPENFKVPFYGKIIRRCCSLPIDREDPRKALVTIKTAAEILKNDTVSMGVYPEGTRSLDGQLLPFHNGVFKIAQQAGTPIVVMTVDGTELISKNFPFHTTEVTFKVAETIPAEEVQSMRSKEIGDRVYRDFVRNLAHEEHMDEQAMCYN